MIICLSGLAGSGKSVVSEFLQKDGGFAAIAFADPLKTILKEVYDFSDEQLYGPSEMRSKPDERYPRRHSFNNHQICLCCSLSWSSLSLKEQRDPPQCYLTPRYALQELGTKWGRDCYEDTWVENAFRRAKRYMDKTDPIYNRETGVTVFPPIGGVVITDGRFLNELEASKKAGGFLVRIKRPKHIDPKWNHSSETEQLEMEDSEFDTVINNDGTLEDLREKVLKHILYR